MEKALVVIGSMVVLCGAFVLGEKVQECKMKHEYRKTWKRMVVLADNYGKMADELKKCYNRK